MDAMMITVARMRNALLGLMGTLAMAASAVAPAQVQPVDPDRAIDGDLVKGPQPAPAPAPAASAAPATNGSAPTTPPPAPATTAPQPASGTYKQDDLIGAAEGVFGKGAQGLARMIEDILRKQGEPNGYIVGREGGAALGIGLRYGSGTLHHKVEGQRPVYWTGPSIGFDAGANAGNTFVLVYNLYDSEELYKRFPAGEGQVYVIGGFHASYLRRGNTVLIPVRMGAGLRLGINAGYMKFSKKQRWLPL
jgi:hypothetical protein